MTVILKNKKVDVFRDTGYINTTQLNRDLYYFNDTNYYHGLRGSASPVLTATGCQWELAIFDPPQNKHPLTDHQKIWYRWLRRRPLRLRLIWCDGGLLGKWVKYNEIFFYLFIPFFHQLTYRSDATTDFHAWWLKRRGLAQGCAFWGFRWHWSPF